MKRILSLLSRRFRRQPSVDGIVSSFNKTVRKLEAVSERQSEEAQRLKLEARRAERLAADAACESDRAKNVAEKLGQMVS